MAMEIEMSARIETVLVYGAAGAQGSAIVRAALSKGVHVRVLLRPGRANPFGGSVDVVRGDLADRESLDRASLGVDKVVLTLPLLHDRLALVRLGRNAVDAARAAGVTLIVLNTSGPLSDGTIGSAFADALADTHAYLASSGVPAITLSPTVFCGNLTEPWSAPVIVDNGVVAYPLPADFPVSWISWEDLASYAVAALARPDLAGRAFRVGGPEALTGIAVAEALSGAIGRSVTYFAVPLPDFAEGLAQRFGRAAASEVAAYYAWLQAQPASPLAVDIGPALEALPIAPTRFADWARAQAWSDLASGQRAA